MKKNIIKKVSIMLLFLCCLTTAGANDPYVLNDKTGWSYFVGCICNATLGDENDEEWVKWMEENGLSPNTALFIYHAYCIYKINGVVEKNGKTYHKVYVDVIHLDGGGEIHKIGPGHCNDVYDGKMPAVRKEGGRIYVDEEDYMEFLKSYDWNFPSYDAEYMPYERTDDGELILYDFTMKVGDTFRHVDGYDDVSVIAVTDTCLADGTTRKLQTLSNGLQILEGVGCLNSKGMLFLYLNYKRTEAEKYYEESSNYTLFTGLEYFGDGDYGEIYSQTEYDIAATGINEAVKYRRQPVDDVVYDLGGRRMTGALKPGVYIRGGKKVVIR